MGDVRKTGAKDDTEILDLDFRTWWEQKGERGKECGTARMDECACVHVCVRAAGGWMVADSFRISAWSVVISPFSERLFLCAWTWAQQVFPVLCDSAHLAMGVCLGVAT